MHKERAKGLLNLQDALKRLFERKHEQLGHLVIWEPTKEEQAKQSHEALPTQSSEPLQPISVGPKLSPSHKAQRQLRRERRKQRYDEVIKLHEQGVSQVAIATLLGLDRDTVRHYFKAPSFPEIVRPKRGSLLDPYKQYRRERWATGQCTARSLFAELRARGYQGGATLVSDYLRLLREHPDWWDAYQQQKARQARGAALSTPGGWALHLSSAQTHATASARAGALTSGRRRTGEYLPTGARFSDDGDAASGERPSPMAQRSAGMWHRLHSKALSPGSTGTMMRSERLWRRNTATDKRKAK
jgi:hypothetical protein